MGGSLQTVRLAAAIALAAACSGNAASAQSLWPDRSRPNSISLELMKPVYEIGDQTLMTSVGFLDARVHIAESVHLVAEVPLSIYDSQRYSYNSTTIGNPYAGLELGGLNSIGRVEVGVRLPLTDSNEYGAILNGTVADLSRIGAFAPNIYMFQAIADLRTPPLGGMYLRLRAGPQITFETGGGGGDLLGNYALIAGYEGKAVRFGAGIAGLAVIPMYEMDLGDATIHQLQINANFGSGRFRPGVFGSIWLDEDMQADIPLVLGFTLSWEV